MANQDKIIEDLKKLIGKQVEFLTVVRAELQVIRDLIVESRTDRIPDDVKKRIDSLIRMIERTILDIKEGKILFKEF